MQNTSALAPMIFCLAHFYLEEQNGALLACVLLQSSCPTHRECELRRKTKVDWGNLMQCNSVDLAPQADVSTPP